MIVYYGLIDFVCFQSKFLGEVQKKERVLFNMKAQSPLVSHYLKMLGLRAAAAAEGREGRHNVPRTHITRQPPPPTTKF